MTDTMNPPVIRFADGKVRVTDLRFMQAEKNL